MKARKRLNVGNEHQIQKRQELNFEQKPKTKSERAEKNIYSN